MESKLCVICDTEKSFDKFYLKYGECKQCDSGRSLIQSYENKDEISKQ